MSKVRQDAWSHEDDLLLAETVLRHVREGSTQLNAFEEVGDQLNRTSAACGFRWNAEVRKKYIDAMELAKRQRKEKKRAEERRAKRSSSTIVPTNTYVTNDTDQMISHTSPALSMDQVIQFLKHIEQNYDESHKTSQKLTTVQQENDFLKKHVDELEKKLANTEKQLTTIQGDYQTFIQIMDRARKMTVLEDQHSLKSPAFKMDKNGNLEQIAQNFNT